MSEIHEIDINLNNKKYLVLKHLENKGVSNPISISVQTRILPTELMQLLTNLIDEGLVLSRYESNVVGNRVIAISGSGRRALRNAV